MSKKKNFRLHFLFAVFFLFFPLLTASAEKFESPETGFSINPVSGWLQKPTAYEGVLVTYWKEGTIATFHVTVRDLDKPKTVDDLKWEDLFSPQFEDIELRQEGQAMIGGEKARYCIYAIKPGPFKTQMEQKFNFKYINYVLIHANKLYSITFKDLQTSFGLDYASFLESVRSIKFLDQQSPREKSDAPAEDLVS